jgi:hypothetical protein
MQIDMQTAFGAYIFRKKEYSPLRMIAYRDRWTEMHRPGFHSLQHFNYSWVTRKWENAFLTLRGTSRGQLEQLELIGP